MPTQSWISWALPHTGLFYGLLSRGAFLSVRLNGYFETSLSASLILISVPLAASLNMLPVRCPGPLSSFEYRSLLLLSRRG